MKSLLLVLTAVSLPLGAYANDSIGFVATGGIQYLKTPHIAMESEDLYISQQQIRVAYRFKNLSKRDITETVLFPLPILSDGYSADFADTAGLIKSFKIEVDGKKVQPKTHVRAFMYQKDAEGSHVGDPIDVTAALKGCGFSDSELMNPWTDGHDLSKLHAKLDQCKDLQILKLRKYETASGDGLINETPWAAQIVYSWPQTFKAGAVTEVKHQYTPLVGGSMYFDASKSDQNAFYSAYCIDDQFRRKMKKSGKDYPVHRALSYVLTTGANWAKPIGTFTLTIDRAPNELVSLCWDKSLKKVGANRFRAVKHNFTPTRDLDIIFAEGYDGR